jgi:competence protein ComEC
MTITLMVNPSYPLNLGWLLSFAAFFGILVVSPLLEKYFYGDELQKKTHFFGRLVITSISTLLMTAPILLFFYGKISLISILANILISPTIALAMGLTFLTGFSSLLSSFLASVFGFLASSFGFLTDQIIHYHIFVVQSLAEIKFFLIEIKPQNPLAFLVYIPVLVMLGLVWRRTTRSRGRGGLSRSTR